VILYIDGVRIASKSTSGAIPESNTKPFRVGANPRVTPPGNFFTGEIDEVRVWNDDLTAGEVASAFAGSSFNNADQVLHIDFSLLPCPDNLTMSPACVSQDQSHRNQNESYRRAHRNQI
jgi:hypothetical protein